jgi:hypothetical protein
MLKAESIPMSEKEKAEVEKVSKGKRASVTRAGQNESGPLLVEVEGKVTEVTI